MTSSGKLGEQERDDDEWEQIAIMHDHEHGEMGINLMRQVNWVHFPWETAVRIAIMLVEGAASMAGDEEVSVALLTGAAMLKRTQEKVQ
jgi:hypothetical protein